MREIWRPIAGYPDYEVSDQGRVRSWRIKGNTNKPVTTPRILKASPCGSNQKYRAVKLYKDNKGYAHRVHRLVLEAFVGPMPLGLECRHLNGNAADNALSNLAYGTHQQNMEDQAKHGTSVNPKGESHGNAKLTEAQVLYIREQVATKQRTQIALAHEFGVDSTTISLIIRRKKWKHI